MSDLCEHDSAPIRPKGQLHRNVSVERTLSSPVDELLLKAKMQNQSAEPVNSAAACAAAFPGSKATFEQVLEWRQHPGWRTDIDPFLNGHIKGGEPQPPPPTEDDEAEPARTPEFELSRMLDETMREVYKHLHDAFTDKTCDGQEIYLGRAYRTITQFQMDHISKLTKVQTASIAVTRDQVAKFQLDLSESKPFPLSIPMELLEKSFERMNQWRPDDDPMKTMKLAQYIDEEKREAHAKVVAERGPPADVMKTLTAGININVTKVIAEIEKHGRSNGGFNGKGLWFGIDHSALCRNGDVMPEQSFITCKSEGQWKDLLSTLNQLQLVATSRMLPGEQDYISELTDVRHDGLKLVVQYWILELDDSKHENATHKDPRANLLPEVLSGKGFDGTAIVQVWAQVKQLNEVEDSASEGMSVRKDLGEAHEEHDAPRQARSPSPTPRRSSGPPRGGDLFNHLDNEEEEADPNMVQWSKPIMTKGGISTLRHEANKLMERAKACAALGDHKSAYDFAAQAHTLRQQADDVEVDASSAASSPAVNETKVYKPEVKYEYPSGEVRLIEGGYYTESEHLARSMYEQDLITAVKTATDAGVEKAKLTPMQMSKYDSPLSRSMSVADSITVAEKLAPTVAGNAALKRGVMASSRDGSKQSSPSESPKISGKEGPSLPPDAISFKLPQDLVSAAMAQTPDVSDA